MRDFISSMPKISFTLFHSSTVHFFVQKIEPWIVQYFSAIFWRVWMSLGPRMSLVLFNKSHPQHLVFVHRESTANTSAHNRSSACRQRPGPTMGNSPRWFLLASVIICQLFRYDHHYYSIYSTLIIIARSCHFFVQVWRCRKEACGKATHLCKSKLAPKKLVKSLSHSQNGAL